jgi:hypothetical protein
MYSKLSNVNIPSTILLLVRAVVITELCLCNHAHLTAALSMSASNWQPLPHVERRQVLTSSGGLAAAAAAVFTSTANAAAAANSISGGSGNPRSVSSVDSHPVIPVWPTWAGGRVVPVSLGGTLQDPFLLLAHHKHWFDPRDPLRGPFKQVGKLLGLPYVDVEGFSVRTHLSNWTFSHANANCLD